jgi:hypothetical protein
MSFDFPFVRLFGVRKSSLDGMTQSVIQNFLEKGNFFNPSESLAKKSESCPPNNIPVERVCGELMCNTFISLSPTHLQ